jgi:hypothetical protein
VSHPKGRTECEDICEQSPVENISTQEEEVTRGWRKSHYPELRNFVHQKYDKSNQFKEDQMGKTCSTHAKGDKYKQLFYLAILMSSKHINTVAVTVAF